MASPSPSPTPESPPPSSGGPRWRSLLVKAGIGVGGLTLVGGIVGVVWGGRVVNNGIIPQIEGAIEETIGRPVDIGPLTSLSLNGLTLGETVVPPTEKDATTVRVEQIGVSVAWRPLLFERVLRPSITLVRPEVELVQGEDGQWVVLDLPAPSDQEPPVSLELGSLQVRDASLIISTQIQDPAAVVPRAPLHITGVNVNATGEGLGDPPPPAQASLLAQSRADDRPALAPQRIAFDLAGQIEDGAFAIDGEADLAQWALQTQVLAQDVPATGVNLLLPSLAGLASGRLNANLTAAAALNEAGELDLDSVDVQGTARFRDGELRLEALAAPVRDIRSQLRFQGQRVVLEDTGLAVDDIALAAAGSVDVQTGYDLEATLPAIQLATVQRLAQLTLPVEVGGTLGVVAQVGGDLLAPRLTGRLANTTPVQVDQLELATLSADFALTTDQLMPTAAVLQELRVVPAAGGLVLAEGRADFDAGNIENPDLDALLNPTLRLTAQADLPLDALATAYAPAYGVALPADPGLGNLAADVTVDGTLSAPMAAVQWQLQEGIATAQGDLTVDGTDLTDPALQLTAQADVPLDAFAAVYAPVYGVELPAELALGTLGAEVTGGGTLSNPAAAVQWQLQEGTATGQGELTLNGMALALTNTELQVAAGTVTAAATADLAGGEWQATATTRQVPIAPFLPTGPQLPQASGLLSADVDAAGNLYDLDLATIQAGGTATIAEAQVQLTPTSEPLLPVGDWTTAFRWQGDALAVEQFQAPGITAAGTIGVDFSQPIPLGEVALDVALDRFDLRPLNSLAPAPVPDYAYLAGFTSFSGRISGDLTTLQLAGTATLDELALNQIAFAPLSGPVDIALATGGEVNLTGGGQRLQLAIDETLWPTSFAVDHSQFAIAGTGSDRQLTAQVTNFPLELLDVQPAPALELGVVRGTVNVAVSADLTDFANPSAQGTLTVADPGLDTISAEAIEADFRYADGTAFLDRGLLVLPNSRYQATAQLALLPTLQYQAEVTIPEGRIEDLLAAMGWQTLQDIGLGQAVTSEGSAADLTGTAAALPAGSLLEQLAYFEQFLAELPPPRTVDTLALPPLSDLVGGFRGTLAVQGEGLDPLAATATVDLQGGDWRWGPYAPPNTFIVDARYANGQVALNPVQLTAGEMVVNVAGGGTLNRLDTQILVDNLPVEVVQAIYPLPVSVTGEVAVATAITGSALNPAVAGTVAVIDPVINQHALTEVGLDFGYRNALFTLDGQVIDEAGDAPITLAATVPVELPFSPVVPVINRLSAEVRVPSDNFDLLNVLTADQLRWEAGRGEVVIQAGGSLDELENLAVAGTVTLQEAQVAAAVLDTPVTNLNGDITFNLERVGIEQFTATLGTGELAIAGELPWQASGASVLVAQANRAKQESTPDPSVEGLTLTLTALPINYEGIVSATFDGQIAITEAALSPTVGGHIGIDQGQINAIDLLRKAGAITLPTAEELEEINPYRAELLGIDPLAPSAVERPPSLLDQVTLQDFTVVFNDRLVVAGSPFFNITTVGGLAVNGTLAKLQPAGTIRLNSGWINLFSTQFRLDAGAPNSATFTPEAGLDPYIDVVMAARVQESNITPVPSSAGGFVSAEVTDTSDLGSVGDVEFINVQARVEGHASQLTDPNNTELLTLTSTPQRSQQDLLALIGTNLVGGLSTATVTQLAGFLGSGALAGVGSNVANAVGLQSFSVFPTTDPDVNSTVGVGIGVEASFRVGNSIGVNLLQILNSSSPPQVGLQYRFTDQIQLRGSTNLTDTGNEVRLEYRTRF